MDTIDIDRKIAFVIPSCDQYSDLWPSLFQALRRFWPEHSFRTYLITNHLSPAIEGVAVVGVGDDVSWSDNLSNALAKIAEDYILLNMDDLILHNRVDHGRLCTVVSEFISRRGNYLRLNPTPKGVDVGEAMDIVPAGDVYRASVVFSIWRKDVLKSILRSGESAWDFERYGSIRSDCFGAWFAAKDWLLSYVNLVIQGKVDPRALAVLDRCGVVYRAPRPVWSGMEMLKLVAKERRSVVFGLLPRRSKRAIRDFFGPG